MQGEFLLNILMSQQKFIFRILIPQHLNSLVLNVALPTLHSEKKVTKKKEKKRKLPPTHFFMLSFFKFHFGFYFLSVNDFSWR